MEWLAALVPLLGIIYWFLKRKRGRIDPKLDLSKKIASSANANVQKMRKHLMEGDTDALENDLDRQQSRIDALRGLHASKNAKNRGGKSD